MKRRPLLASLLVVVGTLCWSAALIVVILGLFGVLTDLLANRQWTAAIRAFGFAVAAALPFGIVAWIATRWLDRLTVRPATPRGFEVLPPSTGQEVAPVLPPDDQIRSDPRWEVHIVDLRVLTGPLLAREF